MNEYFVVQLKKTLFAIGLGLLVVEGVLAQTEADVELVSQDRVATVGVFDEQYFQQQVDERNTDCDAFILMAKKDRALELVLTSQRHEELWRKPIPSQWVMIASEAQRIALVDKPFNSGFATSDGRTEYQGVLVWDFDGKQIFQVPDAKGAALSSSADLLIPSDESVSLVGADGELKWKLNVSNHSAEFIGNGQFVKILSWDASKRKFVIRLVDAESGELLKSWTYAKNREMRILHVDSKTERLVMAEFDLNRKRPCDLMVYQLNSWETKASLRGRLQAPFSVAWNPHREVYCFLSNDSDGVSMFYWDSESDLVSKKVIGPMDVDYSTDGVKYDSNEEVYVVTIGQETYTFQHCK